MKNITLALTGMIVFNTAVAQASSVGDLPLKQPQIIAGQNKLSLVATYDVPSTIEAPGGKRLAVRGLFQYGAEYVDSKHGKIVYAPSITPPTLKFKQRQAYAITLRNDMSESFSATGIATMMDAEGKFMEHEVPFHDTNLHVHGMNVPPCNKKEVIATGGDRDGLCFKGNLYKNKYGDYALVTLKPKSGNVGNLHDVRTPIEKGKIEYYYDVSHKHPSGLSWYHPHIHGTSSSQVGGGMAGLITVGNFKDYAEIPTGIKLDEDDDIKTLLLKDFQVYKDKSEWRYKLQDIDNDPLNHPPKVKWCDNNPQQQTGDIPGTCSDNPTNPSRLWLFTTNGQLSPTITVKKGQHQVWRLANMSANVTHNLKLIANGQDVELEILSQDGTPTGEGNTNLKNTVLKMMPATRMEILVDAAEVCNALSKNTLGKSNRNVCDLSNVDVKLISIGGEITGGDVWPSNITVAKISFEDSNLIADKEKGEFKSIKLQMLPNVWSDKSKSSQMLMAQETNRPTFMVRRIGLKNDFESENGEPCTPSTANQNACKERFMMSKLDFQKLNEEPTEQYWNKLALDPITTKKYESFNLDNPMKVVLPAEGRVVEYWIIQNDSAELHNFHLHQTKFQVVHQGSLSAAQNKTLLMGQMSSLVHVESTGKNMVDVYPIKAKEWIAIRVVFDRDEQLGRYVYHCHILEHEDKGMMAAIEVSRQLPAR